MAQSLSPTSQLSPRLRQSVDTRAGQKPHQAPLSSQSQSPYPSPLSSAHEIQAMSDRPDPGQSQKGRLSRQHEQHTGKNPQAQSQRATERLAIPRLKREADPDRAVFKAASRQRISHACEPCRQRKTRCSGERPVCRHCNELDIKCYYTEGKRDREKKSLKYMADKLASYEALLRDLQRRSSSADADRITTALDQVDSSITDYIGDVAMQDRDPESVSDRSRSVGSVEDIDHAEEDHNKDDETQATGFLGKNSEISWMQRVKQHQNEDYPATGNFSPNPEKSEGNKAEPTLPDIDPAYSASSMSYHLDEVSIIIDDVDAYQLPSRDIAMQLFHVYIDTVHSLFPIIGKDAFMRQFRNLLGMPQVNLQSAGLDKWLAVLNMMFAISATYSHLTLSNWKGGATEHLVYFNRARKLAVNSKSTFSHPDLRQIQVHGLMAFYFVATDQINRAWMCMGIALRATAGLGINLRNDSTNIADKAKEIRYRVWWSLYTLESHLSMLTGRQNSLIESVCTTPLPAPFEEEDLDRDPAKNFLTTDMQKRERAPNVLTRTKGETAAASPTQPFSMEGSVSRSGILIRRLGTGFAKDVQPNSFLCFLHYVQLTRVSQEVLSRLYTPEATQKAWPEIQELIQELDDKLQNWKTQLPDPLDFTSLEPTEFPRFRLTLGFLFHGIRITIHRPCLCRQKGNSTGGSQNSRDFTRDSAVLCVQSAKALLELLPRYVDARQLYRISPWWYTLHCVMQATSVLLLELSLRVYHLPEMTGAIVTSAKTAVRWLHAMATENKAARKAWAMCNDALRDLSQRLGHDLTDLPATLPGYTHVSALPPMKLATGFPPTQPMNPTSYTQFLHTYYQQPTSLSIDQSLAGQYADPIMNFLDPAFSNPYDQHMPFNLTSTDLVPTQGSAGDMDIW